MANSPIRTVLLTLALLLTGSVSAQEIINVRSGNGPIGGTDSQITMLVGPVDAGFGIPFTLNDFVTAQTGPPAVIPTPAGDWGASLSGGSTAQWITTGATIGTMGSALYAINFNVTTSSIVAATISVSFLVDDFFGGPQNEGLFVNTFPVPGSSPPLVSPWAIVNQMTGLDVSTLIVPGQNTLYLYARDTAGAGGLCFDATITIYETASIAQLAPLLPGGIGAVSINAGVSRAGDNFLIAPSASAPLGVGLGIPIGANTEIRLPLTDSLLDFALSSPAAAAFFPSLQGTISPANGLGAILIYVPLNPSLTGTPIWWQGLMFDGATGAPTEATNVLQMTVL